MPVGGRAVGRNGLVDGTVDRYDEDWTSLAWVQLLGRTEIVDAGGRDDVLEALAERYRHYRERRPPGPLIRLRPSRVIYWRAEPDNLR